MRWGASQRRLPAPASCANIDLARVEVALVKHRANVHAAARELNVPSADLRKLTWSHPRLVEVALEEAERLVDRAEAKLNEALDGDHKDRALSAAMFILRHHRAAAVRGWSQHGGSDDVYDPPPAAAPTVVIWAGDMPAGYKPGLPDAPEARRSALVEADLASDDDRIH